MYLHRDLSIARPHITMLTELEQELGLPIRVMLGSGGGNYTSPAWHASHKAACPDFTDEQCRDTGITIVPWASFHEPTFNHWQYVGGLGLFNEAREYAYDYYDLLTMPDNSGDWVAEPLFLSDGATAVGEVNDRCITLSWNWFYYREFRAEELIRQAIMLSMDEERATSFKERMATIVQQRFVKYAKRASNAGLEDVRREVGRLMTTHDGAMRTAATAKIELRQKQRLLDALIDGDGVLSEQGMFETWAKLLDDPRIEDVTFDSAERIVITTTGLMIKHPGTGQEEYLGKMRWKISVTDSLCSVENLDNARGGYDHPHVFMNQPCFGDLGSTIYTLIKQGNLYPAVEMIFAFLKSINMNDDWGRRAAFWFEDPMDSPRAITEDPPMEDLTADAELAEVDRILAELVEA